MRKAEVLNRVIALRQQSTIALQNTEPRVKPKTKAKPKKPSYADVLKILKAKGLTIEDLKRSYNGRT